MTCFGRPWRERLTVDLKDNHRAVIADMEKTSGKKIERGIHAVFAADADTARFGQRSERRVPGEYLPLPQPEVGFQAGNFALEDQCFRRNYSQLE